MKVLSEKGQAMVEYTLISTVLMLLGFLALRLWAGALGGFLKLIVRWRCGETGMLP